VTLRSVLNVKMSENGILHAGAEVFAKRGFAATRVEDILEAAGVARRTFYKYYGSKEEVLAAIYELATGELTAAIQSAAVAASNEPLDALRMGLDAYLDYHVANAQLVRVLVQQALVSDSPLAPKRRRFRDDLIVLIDAAVRANTGGAGHDRIYYEALISAVEGVPLYLLASKPSKTDIARAKEALHLLLERALGSLT